MGKQTFDIGCEEVLNTLKPKNVVTCHADGNTY